MRQDSLTVRLLVRVLVLLVLTPLALFGMVSTSSAAAPVGAVTAADEDFPIYGDWVLIKWSHDIQTPLGTDFGQIKCSAQMRIVSHDGTWTLEMKSGICQTPTWAFDWSADNIWTGDAKAYYITVNGTDSDGQPCEYGWNNSFKASDLDAWNTNVVALSDFSATNGPQGRCAPLSATIQDVPWDATAEELAAAVVMTDNTPIPTPDEPVVNTTPACVDGRPSVPSYTFTEDGPVTGDPSTYWSSWSVSYPVSGPNVDADDWDAALIFEYTYPPTGAKYIFSASYPEGYGSPATPSQAPFFFSMTKSHNPWSSFPVKVVGVQVWSKAGLVRMAADRYPHNFGVSDSPADPANNSSSVTGLSSADYCLYYFGEKIAKSSLTSGDGSDVPLGDPILDGETGEDEEPSVDTPPPPPVGPETDDADNGCGGFSFTDPSTWAGAGICVLVKLIGRLIDTVARLLNGVIGVLRDVLDAIGDLVGDLMSGLADMLRSLFMPTNGAIASFKDSASIEGTNADEWRDMFKEGIGSLNGGSGNSNSLNAPAARSGAPSGSQGPTGTGGSEGVEGTDWGYGSNECGYGNWEVGCGPDPIPQEGGSGSWEGGGGSGEAVSDMDNMIAANRGQSGCGGPVIASHKIEQFGVPFGWRPLNSCEPGVMNTLAHWCYIILLIGIILGTASRSLSMIMESAGLATDTKLMVNHDWDGIIDRGNK